MPAKDLYCVIGNPVAHSRSPWIHARFAELTGQQLVYERLLAPHGGFADALAAFAARPGAHGCNVTVPFKHDAAAAAHTASERVLLAGAANTLVLQPDGRIHADNTDGIGLVADIVQGAACALRQRDVLLLGAGGAAAGVLAPLLEEQPRRLVVANRTHARAAALVQRHAEFAALQNVELQAIELQGLAHDFDVIINATASSLAGAALVLPAQLLREGGLAYDMMYGPAAEPFLAWARGAGAQARNGLGMLVQQAAAAFALWRGIAPPADQVLSELRVAMAAGRA